MSEEKVLTLRGKKAVWAPGGGSGPIDPKRLPEGYPYKEQSETVIEWDGNTEGKECVADTFYHVSDAVLTNEDIKAGIVSVSDGTQIVVANVFEGLENYGAITEDFAFIESAAFIRKAGVEINGLVFNSVGVYFMNNGTIHIASFASKTETIQPMAEEFLPLLTSPNGTKYKLTVADDGTLSAVEVIE